MGNPLNGEAGFRHIGGQHHQRLTVCGCFQHLLLLRQRQPPMQFAHWQTVSGFGQTPGYPANIPAAGKKHQYHLGVSRHGQNLLHAVVAPILT